MNIKKGMLLPIAILFATTLFLSCQKEAGPGGTSTITGKVLVRSKNADFTILKAEYWAQDQDVFIIYGNDSVYSDKFKTNYDGSYRFKYLNKGDYTIFAYSEDSTFTSPSGVVAVKVNVSITDNRQDVIAPLITIFE